MFLNCIMAQTIKSGSYSFKYEVLPFFPLSAAYKNYTIEAFSAATDGVPLSSKFIYLKEKYIDGLENITNVTTSSGIMVGGKIIGKANEDTRTNTNSDLSITVKILNLEVQDKKEYINNTTNFQTNQIQDYYDYKFTFKFPYQLIVRDLIQNKTLLDTTINSPKTTLFPADYRYNSFGDKIEYNGDANKVDLDLDYAQNANTIYSLSKQVLAKTIMNEVKSVLSVFYGYRQSQQNFMFYRIKSKNKIFDVSDTILDNMKIIIDSVDYNCKKNKHLNWHSSNIKAISGKSLILVEKMIENPMCLNEYKTDTEKEEFILKMKRNLIILYLFNDNLTKAQKLLLEIEPRTRINMLGSSSQDETITNLKNLLTREIKLYDNHKVFFGFN